MALWTPESDTSGQALWIDFNDTSTLTLDGTVINQANDKSGNTNHATSTSTARPALSGSYASFDGSNDFMQGAASTQPTGTGPVTVFSVACRVGANGGTLFTERISTRSMATQMFQIGGLYYIAGNGVDAGANTTISSTDYLKTASKNNVYCYQSVVGSRMALWLDGNQITVTAGTQFAHSGTAGYRIGTREASAGQWWNGLIGEVIVIPRTLSTADRQLYEGYLAWKWDGINGNTALVDALPSDHAYKTNNIFTIPDVIGETQSNAITILEGEGYTVVSQIVTSLPANLGLVVFADLTGSKEVTISVGDGLGAIVPDVDTLTNAAAIAVIEAAGFVASSKGSYSTGTIGEVFGQSPGAGELLALGGTVQILYTSTNTPPAEITTWTELNAMRLNLAGDYVLINDLFETDGDYVGIGDDWVPVGSLASPFTGSFVKGVGAQKIIRGLKISDSTSRHVGFFGTILSDGDFIGISFVDASVVSAIAGDLGATTFVGGFCGRYQSGGAFESMFFNGSVSSVAFEAYTGGMFGGVIQQTKTINISMSAVDSIVATKNQSGYGAVIGGFAGAFFKVALPIRVGSAFYKCASFGQVSSETTTTGAFGNKAGGFFGELLFSIPAGNSNPPVFADCYSQASVTAASVNQTNNGGFVGSSGRGDGNLEGKSSWSSGVVNAVGGGFVGAGDIVLTSCYYDSTISGKSDTNGGTVPKTTAQMKQEATFTGWDFTDTWYIDETVDYPRLLAVDKKIVPDVVGDTEAVGVAAIAAALLVSVVIEAFSETAAAGIIISTDPVAGTEVAVGSSVDVVVSKGPAKVSTPNLLTLTGTNASATIVAAGLSVGTISVKVSSATPGTVIAQSPAAGTMLNIGAAVSFTLAVAYKRTTAIGYDSILGKPGVTVTASSTADGYFVSNLWDNATYDGWRSEEIS